MAAFEFVMRRGDSAVGISTPNPRRYLGSGIPPIFSAVALRVKRIGEGLHSAATFRGCSFGQRRSFFDVVVG